jgi:hypothetical protein
MVLRNQVDRKVGICMIYVCNGQKMFGRTKHAGAGALRMQRALAPAAGHHESAGHLGAQAADVCLSWRMWLVHQRSTCKGFTRFMKYAKNLGSSTSTCAWGKSAELFEHQLCMMRFGSHIQHWRRAPQPSACACESARLNQNQVQVADIMS